MKYIIVSTFDGIGNNSTGIANLENEVNKLITEGWQPQGGVQVVCHGSGGNEYYQAMVKN